MKVKTLRHKMFIVMTAAVLLSLFTSITAAAVIIKRASAKAVQASANANTASLDVIRSAFYQNELEEQYFLLLLGLQADIPEGTGAGDALKAVAVKSGEYSYVGELIFFCIKDKNIVAAVSGDPTAETDVESLSAMLARTIDSDPVGYGLVSDVDEYISLIDYASSVSIVSAYAQNRDDSALVTLISDGAVSFPSSLENTSVGIFCENANASSRIEALRAVTSDYMSEAEQNIGDATVLYLVLIFALGAVCSAVTIFLAYRISSYIADPVEREKEEKELALRRAEDLDRRKTEFIGNISHELKTPLTVISGYAQDSRVTIRENPEAVETIDKNMQIITSEADRLSIMVSSLLDITKIDEGKMKMSMCATDPVRLVQDTLNAYYPLFTKHGNSVKFTHSVSVPPVLCDPDRIKQVLINLLANAARHTRDGNIIVNVGENGDHAIFTVSDNGEGISEKALPHIFERYITENDGKERNTGTGLGLYISRYIVEAHGGSIRASSAAGKGTAITFTLPAFNEEPTAE